MTKNERLLKIFTEEQRKTLRKDNPFLVKRNALIQRLYSEGVQLPILVELTGMPRATVHRIATQGYVYGRRKDAGPNGEKDINRLKRRLKSKLAEVQKLLK